MTVVVAPFVFLSLVFGIISAALPTHILRHFIPLFGAAMIGWLAPLALLWMLVLTGMGWLAMTHRPPRISTGAMAGAVMVVMTLALLFLREADWITSLGAAYFTLRIIHVVIDHWLERYDAPPLYDLLVYMLFPPVFVIGPIHRWPEFSRQMARRKVTAPLVFTGFERVLTGLFMIVVLGGYFMRKLESITLDVTANTSAFITTWAASALSWIDLYFVFAGLSSVAIGAALIAGLRISENFDQPYRARSLIDFWTRWHISLTSWVREYVFVPVTAATRQPLIGVVLAMLAIGLWHETSFFYLGWAIWQALGIVVSRLVRPVFAVLPDWLDIAVSPVLILGWLSLANPVVTNLEGMIF